MKTVSLPIASAAVCMIIFFAPELAYAKKRVVCVTGDNSGFTNNYEGYERVRAETDTKAKTVASVEFQVGGKLEDCLAKLADGDELVLIAHGTRGGGEFTWEDGKGGKSKYDGFGKNDNVPSPAPLPAGFDKLKNITVTFGSCWSCENPGPPDNRTTCQKLMDAMKGANNTCLGFLNVASSGVGFGTSVKQKDPKGLEQIAAARKCLEADRSWLKNPPPNRPDAKLNQMTAAQAIVDDIKACPGAAGNVKVTRLVYGVPEDELNQLKATECGKIPPPGQKNKAPVPPSAISTNFSIIDTLTPVCNSCGGQACGSAPVAPFNDADQITVSPLPNPVPIGVPFTIKARPVVASATPAGEPVTFEVLFGALTISNVSRFSRSITVMTDSAGEASIQLTSTQPGISSIRISVPRTGLNTQTMMNSDFNAVKIETSTSVPTGGER